ncbi:MAG: hypothetical protein LAO76_12350 [Acidobacteriia bacterium]|nr:hypothetical protein [Terriglobia bacterium]
MGIRVYLTIILLTYVPMYLAAVASGLPLAKPSMSLHLPFLYDVNVAFMFLVSFPVLIGIIVTDQEVLTSALRQVQLEKVLIMSRDAAQGLRTRWERRFRAINVAAQVIGILTGITIAWWNYKVYVQAPVGFWAGPDGKLVSVGYVFLVCCAFCYAFVPLFIIRCLGFFFFLKDVVSKAELHLLPFHPDRCGGLRSVGRIGMRNQYVLTFFGINVVLLIIVSFHYFNVPGYLASLIAAAVAAYLLFGPLVFIGPLLPFRAGMLQTKNLLMGEVAQRLRIELERLRQKLPAGIIAKEDEELIDRLRRIGAIIDELPVWPFDAGTLRKFLTAYIIPVLSAVAYPVGKAIFDWLVSKNLLPLG